MRRLLLALPLLVAFGCGGDDGTSDGPSSTDATTTEVATTEMSTEAPTTTVAATTTSAVTTTTAPVAAVDFCTAAEDAAVPFNALGASDDFGDDPDADAALLGAAAKAAASIAASAPASIAADARRISDAYDTVFGLLEQYDFDVNAAAGDDAFMDAFFGMESDEMEAATARVDAFALDECGVELNTGSDEPEGTGDSVPDTEPDDSSPTPTAMVEPDEVNIAAASLAAAFDLDPERARCLAQSLADLGAFDPESNEGRQAYLGVLDACGIELEEVLSID